MQYYSKRCVSVTENVLVLAIKSDPIRPSLKRLPVDVEYLAAEVKAHGPVRPLHDARVRLPLGVALLVETDLPPDVEYWSIRW